MGAGEGVGRFQPDDDQVWCLRHIANTVCGASLHGISAQRGITMLRAKSLITPMVRRRWLKRVADGAVYAITPVGRAWLSARPCDRPGRGGGE